MVNMFLGERFKKIRDDLNMTLQELAKIIDVTAGYLSMIENGKKIPGGEILANLALKLNININWLLTGTGEMYVKHETPAMLIKESKRTYFYEYEGKEFVLVPLKSVYLPGEAPEFFPQSEIQFAFRRDWICKYGDPKKMSMVKMPDHTMEPTLEQGDVLLIDHNRTSLEKEGDGIYAIASSKKLMIRRLQIDPTSGNVLIICDNKKFKPIKTTTKKIDIGGKVIWYGRELDKFFTIA